jgi:hypothetical protein
VLAQTVREVEAAVHGGRVTPAVRTTLQAVTLVLREKRARVRADSAGSDSQRAQQLKRLDAIAAILVRIAVRDAGLLALLAEDAGVSDGARALKRDLLHAAGIGRGGPAYCGPATTDAYDAAPVCTTALHAGRAGNICYCRRAR